MDIPFESKELVLKQVRFGDLQDIEKFNLRFFFPGYEGGGLSKAQPAAGSPMEAASAQGFTVLTDDSVPRRYAGDGTLPRSRYYTVCRTESGEDDDTLVRELLAYNKPNECGFISVIDTTGTSDDSMRARSLFKPGTSAIVCVPNDSPSFPNLYRNAVGMSQQNTRSQVLAIIPTTVQKQKFEKLIDLRVPEVQAWFTRELTNLRDPVSGGLCFRLAGPLTDFTELVSSLLSVSRGDSRRVTQAAGLWLRRMQADALVFPSARSNAYTRFSQQRLQDFGGWNLVDYRDSPPPMIGGFIDLSPEWDEYPTFGGDFLLGSDQTAPFSFRSVRISSAKSGENIGSLLVQGLAEEADHYRGALIGLYFIDQVRKNYKDDIDPDVLLDAFLTASSDGQKNIYIDRASHVASLLLGTVLGDKVQTGALVDLANQMARHGDGDKAGALIQFIQVSQAVQ